MVSSSLDRFLVGFGGLDCLDDLIFLRLFLQVVDGVDDVLLFIFARVAFVVCLFEVDEDVPVDTLLVSTLRVELMNSSAIVEEGEHATDGDCLNVFSTVPNNFMVVRRDDK